jgi:hypothetical protein
LLYDNAGNLVIGGDARSLDTAGIKTNKFQWFCKLTTDFEIIWQKTYRIQTTGGYFQDLSLLTALNFIDSEYSSSPVIEFDIYNSQGTQIITLRKPDQIINVQTNHLPAGIYYWVVRFENEHFSAGQWIKY